MALNVWYAVSQHIRIILARSTRGPTCVEHQIGSIGQQSEWEGRGKVQESETKDSTRKRVKIQQHGYGVFRSTTFAHHPTPVRSLLNNRLGPDDNLSRQNGGSGEVTLGSRFQAEIPARQMTERTLDYETRLVRGGQTLSRMG
jgi:hypothetical protein